MFSHRNDSQNVKGDYAQWKSPEGKWVTGQFNKYAVETKFDFSDYMSILSYTSICKSFNEI